MVNLSNLENIEEPNFYKLLNVPHEAEIEDIIKAYHEACKKFSIFPYASEGEIKKLNDNFSIYKKAYNTLTSEEERKKYDLKLKVSNNKISDTTDLNPEDTIQEQVNEPDYRFNFNRVKEGIEYQMLEKAKKYLEDEKYHEAINLFRKLIELNNKEATYHSYLGLTLMVKGWDMYAQAEFRNALECNPNDPIALNYYNNHYRFTNTLNPDVLQKVNEKPNKINFFAKIKTFLTRKN